MTGQDIEKLASRLVLAATAIDPESLAQRHNLFSGMPFGPPDPVLPDWVDTINDFVNRNCFAGLVGAVLELGAYANSGLTSDAKGITSVSPNICPGAQISIGGSGFGATQPGDVRVYVPVSSGGCREAVVDQWSDTLIIVRAPSNIAAGCVGFVRGSGVYHPPQRVTGELTSCIGAVGEAWTKGFDRVNTPIVSCPPCLPGGQNRIQLAGNPVVITFGFSPQHVEPNGQPILSWNVSNASNIQIFGVMGNGPALQLPNPIPAAGSVTLAPVGGPVPVQGVYRLVATNGCGQSSVDAAFSMSPTPKLAVSRIEVVQSIQKPDNSVRLTANRRTAIRVFVDSGITNGFDFGLGPNRINGVRGPSSPRIWTLARSLDAARRGLRQARPIRL